VQALRLTSRAARIFSDGCLQSVYVELASQIADLAAAAPRLAALRELSVRMNSASDVATLAAVLPSLGRHCRIDTLDVTHEQVSGQLDLVGLQLQTVLPRLTSLTVSICDCAEDSNAAAECHDAYTAAAGRLPLLERLSVIEDARVGVDVPVRRFDAALRLGAWPMLQVRWGGAGRAQGLSVGSSCRCTSAWNPGGAVQLLFTALGL
jgi:hypothetical protein